MKKIIDGYLYDTEIARPVFIWENGLTFDDLEFCRETMYYENRRLFIHFQGRGYAKVGGEDIKMITVDKADEWLKDRRPDIDSEFREF